MNGQAGEIETGINFQDENLSTDLKHQENLDEIRNRVPSSEKLELVLAEALNDIRRKIIDIDTKVVGQERELVEPEDRDDFEARIKYIGELAFKAGQRSGLGQALEIVMIKEYIPDSKNTAVDL